MRLPSIRSSTDRLIILCVAGLLLVIYGLTMPPSLTWHHHGADGGDLAAAVAQVRLPHPPGFPTYLLLASLFARLPFGDLAFRLGLLSAISAAAAAGLTASAVFRLVASGGDKDAWGGLAALVAGLALGLAPLFWSQALIVEVYALAAFFSALAIWLALRDTPAWLVGLTWGVGVALHPTLVFLGPALWFSPLSWEKDGREKPWRYVFVINLAAALGWALMAGPILLAFGSRPSPWGDVGTLHGWWVFVSGRLYRGYLFALSPSGWPARFLAWLGVLARQFTPLGAILAAWGWVRLRRLRRPWTWGSAVAFAAFNFYALAYDTADSLVYLVPVLPLGALWLGIGVARGAAWLRDRWPAAAGLALLLPLLQALLFWGAMDLSGDVAAMAWAEEVLEEAPAGAVILTAKDAHTFTLWYARDGLGLRPDVVVLDVDLWSTEPYRRQVAAALGVPDPPAGLSAEEAARRSGRPIYDGSGHFHQMR